MNSFNAIGNLGRDNELKYTQKGKAVLKNSLAVRRNRKSSETGEYETDWINITFFGNKAESFSRFTRKGNKVGVTGRIQTSTYENQKGDKVYYTECIAEDFTLIESNASNPDSHSDQQNQSQPNNDISRRIDNLEQPNQWGRPDYEKIEGRQMNIPADDLPF